MGGTGKDGEVMAAQDVPFGASEQLGFTELLQVISLRSRTGRLTLTSDSGQAMLVFDGGRVVGGDLLPPTQTADLTTLSPEARRDALEADIQRVLIEVLSWQSGRAAFHATEPAETAGPGFDVDRLLIRAVGTLDEWQSVGATLPSAGECLIWAETRPVVTTATPLSNLQRNVLALCNGRLSLAEIARRLHALDLDILRCAQDLMQRQYVRLNQDAGDSAFDTEVETTLSRVAVELQVRTAAIAQAHHREKQVQGLTAVMVDAVNALLAMLRRPDADSSGDTQAWLTGAVLRLQRQYGALELVTLDRDGVHVGDLLTAYSSLSGTARDGFYGEAIDGLYHLLLQLAVYVVEQRVRGRTAAERVRSTLGALLLEIETAIQAARLSVATANDAGLAALRRKHFHLVV